jgi:hypothetical protein
VGMKVGMKIQNFELKQYYLAPILREVIYIDNRNSKQKDDIEDKDLNNMIGEIIGESD